MPAHVTYVDGKCTCCPYGYHVDLDFLNFCQNLEAGSTLRDLKRIQKTKRNLRKSMEIMLSSEEGKKADPHSSFPQNISGPSDAERLLHMINYEQAASHNILRHIDTSVTAMASYRDDRGDWRHLPSHGDGVQTQTTMFQMGYNQHEDPSHRTWSGAGLTRGDSFTSLSSESSMSSEALLYQTELLQEQQHGHRNSKTTTKLVANPVLEMATAEMKHYSTTSTAQLAGNRSKTADVCTPLERKPGLDWPATTSTNLPRPHPDVDEMSIQLLRESMDVSLQRIKVLEQQVKTIPILQVRISVLKEEKRLLNMQLKASTRFQISSDVREDIEHSTKSSRSPTTKPAITSSMGVGDHSILEPYNLQPHLHTGYTIKDNETTFEIQSRAFLEDERLAISESLKRTLLQESHHDTSTWAAGSVIQTNLKVGKTQKSSPRSITRTIGVGEGNVFEGSNLQVHDKEIRTLIIGSNSGPAKRNVGIECRVPTRDVGVSFRCDDIKPETRTVGVNVSYDTSSILTSLDFKGENQLRMALQDVLHKSVRSVGTTCSFKQTTADNGTMTDLNAGVSVGCGDDDHNVDVEVRQATVRKSAAVIAKPDVGHKSVNTEAGWTLDASTNTFQVICYDKAVITDKQKQSFVSTNTEATRTHPASIQTEQTVFLSTDQVKHASNNTDDVIRYSTGMSTDIITTHTAATNTIEVSGLFQEASSNKISSLGGQSSQSSTETHNRYIAGDKTDSIHILSTELRDETRASNVTTSNVTTSNVTTCGHKYSDHEDSFLSKSEYSKESSRFDNGSKHYSSFKVFNHSSPISQDHVCSQGNKTSRQKDSNEENMIIRQEDSNEENMIIRQEDSNEENMIIRQEDMSTRQSVTQKASSDSPEDRFSETVVEHFLLTKDGKKLISEETITTSSAGTNRTFKQFMDTNHQTAEPAASHHTESFTAGRTMGDIDGGGWSSTSSSGSYSFRSGNESNNVVNRGFTTATNGQSILEEPSTEASSALKTNTVDSSSGLYDFSGRTSEDIYKDSRQKITSTDEVSSAEMFWNMRRAGSVEDFIPNDIRRYMSINPSTPTISGLSGDLTHKSSEEFSSTASSHSTATSSDGGEVQSFKMSHTVSANKSGDTGFLQKVQITKGSGNQLTAVTEQMDVEETEKERRTQSSHVHFLDKDVSGRYSSSARTFSSSVLQGEGHSSIGYTSSTTKDKVATSRSNITSGVDSFSEVLATTETDGSNVVATDEGESLDRKATQLKSIMKHQAETQSVCSKKGITFAKSVTGGYELPDEVRKACLILATYLTDSTSIQTKELNASQEVVKQEWFQVSSHKMSGVRDIEHFLSSIREVSARLMEYIVNLTDANGNTAIHYCISHCNFEIASVLLDSKVCDINKRNKAGYTPIMLAGLVTIQNQQHWEIIRRVLSFGEINAKATETQQTALMLAASHGRTEMVKLLAELGANLNLQDEDGSTALMCACEHGHLDVVNFLLHQPDIDVNITDNEGSTALKISMETDHKDIGVLLYKYLNFSKVPFSGNYKKRKGSTSPT